MGVCYYRADAVDDDIPHLHPAFQRQHLEQGQHGIANVVKVKVTRVGPEETKWQDIKGPLVTFIDTTQLKTQFIAMQYACLSMALKIKH